MADISELEQRIAAALDRIGQGLNALNTAPSAEPADSSDVAQISEALQAEREANAQLEERVKAIRERQERVVGRLERNVAQLTEELAKRDSAVARLENVNGQLRANNQALRAANETGVGDPHLINTAMMAELESLRTSRELDRSELDAIIGELKPLVEGRADA